MKPFIHKSAIRTQAGYPVAIGRNYSKVIPTLRETYNNVGDAFYPKKGTYELERHEDERILIERVAKIWDVDIENCWGYTTSGGSEGNMQGLYMAREMFPDGVLYHSDQAHYSIKKIAKILRMKSVVIPSDTTGAIDCIQLERLIDINKPVIVLANIGSTFLGAVDDVKKIHHILQNTTNRMYIHADAAFYGFVMQQLFPGYDGYKYMDSISVSSHKWAGTPVPGGVFMSVKDRLKYIENFEDVIEQRDVTISGSRSGHISMFLNHFFDTVDLEKDVEGCLKVSEYIVRRLSETVPECEPWVNHRSPIIVFNKPSCDIIHKWALATVGGKSHIVALPHVTKEVADAIIHDIAKYFGRRSRK